MRKSKNKWICLVIAIASITALATSCSKNENDHNTEIVTDVDGNTYHTVTIGKQVWMVENLKTTRYNDGGLIPKMPDTISVENISTPGFCWYNNDSAAHKNIYGALYNWHALNKGKICPKGWHVPSETEWKTLTDYLGGNFIAGSKLKESGFSHWSSPNTDANNSSKFKALPGGGFTPVSHNYYNLGETGYYWSVTEGGEAKAYCFQLFYNYSDVSLKDEYKWDYISIRCLKD